MTAYLTTAALSEISAPQKPSIPALTAASSAGNMTAGSCVLPTSLPTVRSWRNRLMSVPDVRSRSPARRTMLTTLLTEPTQPTRRNSGMPESGSAQTPNVCWRLEKFSLRSLPKGNLSTIFWLPTRMRSACQRRPSTTISMPMPSVKNIDLPKKVAYRQRKQKPVLTKLEYKCRRGRTIEDFNQYLEDHPGISVVEMDTVKSARGCRKCLLTFVFRNTNFMLVFLLKDGTQESVLAVFDYLSDRLGLDTFRALFPVILTDNGVEFKNPDEMEHAPNNCQRTKIFYCDPQASWQKPHVEKNHVLLRRIIPKGTSFKDLTKAQVTLAANHVNSVARELFDNKTPFEIFVGENEKKLLDLLDLTPIPPDEVCLKPALLKRKPN